MDYAEDIITFDDGVNEDEIVEVDDVAPFEDDAYAEGFLGYFDDDPNPYFGTYSEE